VRHVSRLTGEKAEGRDGGGGKSQEGAQPEWSERGSRKAWSGAEPYFAESPPKAHVNFGGGVTAFGRVPEAAPRDGRPGGSVPDSRRSERVSNGKVNFDNYSGQLQLLSLS
jgi:hypothetical protein